MKTIHVHIDESLRVNITCTKGRTFDLTVNLDRELTGDSFRLEVRGSSGSLVLAFAQSAGTLSVAGSSVILRQDHAAMNVPTGCYEYDLVDTTGDRRDNLIRGHFIIVPSITP